MFKLRCHICQTAAPWRAQIRFYKSGNRLAAMPLDKLPSSHSTDTNKDIAWDEFLQAKRLDNLARSTIEDEVPRLEESSTHNIGYENLGDYGDEGHNQILPSDTSIPFLHNLESEGELINIDRDRRIDPSIPTTPNKENVETPISPYFELIRRKPKSRKKQSSFTQVVPYQPPVDRFKSKEPHHFPVLSPHDWRLSSPCLKIKDGQPPDFSQFTQSMSIKQGHNLLVGVGPSPTIVSNSSLKVTKVESWGFKNRVARSEAMPWISADVYIDRHKRLLKLVRDASEAQYVSGLIQLGTPQERETRGLTIAAALGKAPTNSTSPLVTWSKMDGLPITEEEFSNFKVGTVLRFTAIKAGNLNSTAPSKVEDEVDFFQAELVEIRNGELVVLVEGSQDLTKVYRIDIGFDETSFDIQRNCLDGLYYDVTRQNRLNSLSTLECQQDFVEKGQANGVKDVAVYGTELRELIVPDLNSVNEEESNVTLSPETNELLDPTPILPSNFLKENQLLASWIQRYRSPTPLVMPGDPELKLNYSQTRAVAMALGEKFSLIQGPPGTGKSQTIVQAIKLLKTHFRIPNPILLVAPTHVATDNLLKLLVENGLNPLRVGKDYKVDPFSRQWTIGQRASQHPLWKTCETLREDAATSKEHVEKLRGLYALSRSKELAEAIETKAVKFNTEWKKYHVTSSVMYKSLMGTADVLLSTALGASGHSQALGQIDFPIVFIDEASMCTEPTTLVPLMKGASHVTLIGDHRQLPPIVNDKEAIEEGFSESLFERFMRQKTVKSTMLDTQYRMHPSISEFPNELFYNSSLHDDSSVQTRPTSIKSKYLPRQGQAHAFINHQNRERSQNQSTMNTREAFLVLSLIRDLLAKNPTLTPSDVGIITPYAAQKSYLKWLLKSRTQLLVPTLGEERAAEAMELEVNTVDGFQGREKRVIIFSSVRANERGEIGFLADKRRLNVAITRAREVLFIIGNEPTLNRAITRHSEEGFDADIWKQYLDFLKKNHLYIQWDEEDFVDNF